MKTDHLLLDKKIELIQWLSSIDDKLTIEKLLEFRKSEDSAWWKSATENEKQSIQKGIEDAENGKLNPHSSAKEMYEKWL